MKPEDRRILLDVAECKRLPELALDRGDIDAFVDLFARAETELFCLVWRQELAGPLSPAEELTPLQAFQADAHALVSRARALEPRTHVAFLNFLGQLVEVEVARG